MREQYSREQKIAYYTDKIKRIEESIQRQVWYLEKIKNRLAYIQSESYQNWNGNLQESLNKLMAKRR